MTQKKVVRVHEKQCGAVGEIVRTLSLRPSFYKRPFISFTADNETKMRCYFFAVVICHQTYGLRSISKHLVGWDYLEHVFRQLGEQHSQLIVPQYLTTISFDDLTHQLACLFSDDDRYEHSSLDRLRERTRLYRNAAQGIEEQYGGQISCLLEKSKGYLVRQNNGLYKLLSKIQAFQDPFCKKSTIFIKLLVDAGLLCVHDPENFVPAMDYHMQRVLLRMGCVEIVNPIIKRKILNRQSLKTDNIIREACIKAITIIAENSGNPVYIMNDFFWPLGRSCCVNTLLCRNGLCNKKPCTFFKTVELSSHTKCVFESVCKASKQDEYAKLWQPIVKTHYY